MDEEIESPLAWSLGTSLRRVADDETFVSDSQILVLGLLFRPRTRIPPTLPLEVALRARLEGDGLFTSLSLASGPG